ncbi:PMS1 protein like protein 1, partial [Dufourea novaeangliae]
MTISALDSDTVKLITTTQVITSVSNAAKELIENALDANANNIEVNLSDNGAALIEVKDDGCGITKTDAPYVALSAYTSKISNFSDMNSLETYGFRGQALYALSTMSDLTIISKTKQEEVATMYTIDHCGCIAKSEPHHRATGTTIQVRQLFKQIPVRRQIITNLKKANQDVKVLESFVKSYAMCKSFVRISYKVDGNVIFTKPSIPTLEEAVTYVLGKKVTTNMTWMDIQNAETSMKLMLPLKGTQNVSDLFQSGAQYIYVNNRPIKHKDLEKVVTRTILDAFQHDSSSRKKPIFLLYILTSAANIDVNLEPNKTSILFKEQKKTKAEKCTTLMEWSKGQVPGLKEPLESDSYHTNVCDGFINFSKQNRSQVVKQNPNMTAPQIAQILTNLWKNLSSEERGYYRDLACDDKIEWDTRQEKTKEKSTTNDKKMRNRLLKVLGKMQTLDTEKQKNLFLRTIVPWKMNLEKVTESFLNNSACKNNSPSIGKISSDLWIVHKSAQLWLLNASCLKEEFNTSSTNANVEGTSNEEEHLKLWLLKNDDSSLLHRLYSL